jgi:hypothetical protein
VYLARKGHQVHAVDASRVGLEKASRLAAAAGLSITTEVTDLSDYVIEPDSRDGIVSIFCHLLPDIRTRLHKAAAAGLRPGGALILEAYLPRQLDYGTGGPPIRELLVSLTELREELVGLDLVVAREVDRDVVEGRLHHGRSAVVQVVGRKPAT